MSREGKLYGFMCMCVSLTKGERERERERTGTSYNQRFEMDARVVQPHIPYLQK
jgi:hypothetical protein